jgi:hypothetical protein
VTPAELADGASYRGEFALDPAHLFGKLVNSCS